MLRNSNDPFELISEYAAKNSGTKVSIFTSISTLFQALPHLASLASEPVVIHVDLSSAYADYGLISSLRHLGFVFLQSVNAKDVEPTAIVSYLVSSNLSLPVIHFFSGKSLEYNGDSSSREEPVVSARKFLQEFKSEASSPAEIITDAFRLVKFNSSSFEYIGPADATAAIVLFGSVSDLFVKQVLESNNSIGLVLIKVYRPWSTADLVNAIPKSIVKLALVEQIHQLTTNWSPLTQDIISDINSIKDRKLPSLVSFQLGIVNSESIKQVFYSIVNGLEHASSSRKTLFIGSKSEGETIDPEFEKSKALALKLENAYTKVLLQLLGSRFNPLNASDKPSVGNESIPEYGYGKYLALSQQRHKLLDLAKESVKQNDFEDKENVQQLLSEWILATQNSDSPKTAGLGSGIINLLQASKSESAKELLKLKEFFAFKSDWIIGSDAWAYDLGNSGVHHVVASGKNLNMLVIDSQPYSEVAEQIRRKKDIGLYALNFGNVYVASVAVYSSYTQLLQALREAERFDGPSVVVAYLPYSNENDDALTVLQETKRAVETGYWPLYRYNPLHSDESQVFKLDSAEIRKNLKEFLDRENKLTLLSKKSPLFARSLQGSYGYNIQQQQKQKAKEAYRKLLDGLHTGPPVTILYASDGGTAESLAKRLQRRAKARGLKSIAMAFDDYSVEELAADENVVFITSTAGQGEFPQNGRAFWDSLKNATELDLSQVKISVFGLGDRLYWPRKEDKVFYNKPSQDLFAKLTSFSAKELAPLGLGDDQDDDGYSTGYDAWEPTLWTALGVDSVAGTDEPPPITNEDIKISSNYLRGTIAEGLQDKVTGSIAATDQQLTKFHGIYMQDDRDVRDERKAAGMEPAYAFMVRVRLPGCIASPTQWLAIDELAETRGNGTFKITTRGTFQLHGVIKENLKPAIRGINYALIDTLAACGDVDRNVVGAASPGNARIHNQVVETAKTISEHLLPETTAYHEIWLEGQDETDKADYEDVIHGRQGGPKKKPRSSKTLVSGSTLVDHEPLYGSTYLPRKFKINIAVPPYNDVDVYAHDIGLIAIVEDQDIVGFNVLAGGGMGVTHNNKKTYPRTGSLLGYVSKDKVVEACEKIMLVQRDHGDRKDRKHARLKYTIDDMGVDLFRSKVEELLGYKFESGKPYTFESNTDTFGWVTDETGLHHFTTFVENGRVEDTPELQFKAGLRELAKFLLKSKIGGFRLTGNQHIIISDITDENLSTVKAMLAQYKLDNVSFSGLRLSSAACVAFPTCGLAMAESERYLPKLITKIESALEEYGLRHDSIVMRMTGCPNGCARPWVAELALVGKAYDTYNLMLGGGFHGQRLNKLYKNSIKEDEILAILKPLFKRWSLERDHGEHFGDFLIRVGVIHETTEGKDFWDHVPEEE